MERCCLALFCYAAVIVMLALCALFCSFGVLCNGCKRLRDRL